MVGGGVGAGVARPQQPSQRFARRDIGAVQEAVERVEAEGVLPGRGGVLLLGVGNDHGGVEVQHQLFGKVGRRAGPPGRRPRSRPPGTQKARCSSETLSSTRQAVGSEATGPNKAGWSRRPLSPDIDVAPSAIDTARSASTWPGK